MHTYAAYVMLNFAHESEIMISKNIKICITGLFVNENQFHFGKNSDQESFWISSDDNACVDDHMKTDGIVIQDFKVVSSVCTKPCKFYRVQSKMDGLI